MKRLAMNLLSILILGSLLTSCGGTKRHLQGDLVVHQTYIKCPEPSTPKYEQLILGKYLLGPDNSQILLDNLEKQQHYLKELEVETNCYKTQAK